jgi:hypothetical protein
MPLSIVEGHKDGAVTDFVWLDTPPPTKDTTKAEEDALIGREVVEKMSLSSPPRASKHVDRLSVSLHNIRHPIFPEASEQDNTVDHWIDLSTAGTFSVLAATAIASCKVLREGNVRYHGFRPQPLPLPISRHFRVVLDLFKSCRCIKMYHRERKMITSSPVSEEMRAPHRPLEYSMRMPWPRAARKHQRNGTQNQEVNVNRDKPRSFSFPSQIKAIWMSLELLWTTLRTLPLLQKCNIYLASLMPTGFMQTPTTLAR